MDVSVDVSVDTEVDTQVDTQVDVSVTRLAGERVGDRALRRQATMNASKTVVLGMLAAASMGMMQTSPSNAPFASLALAIPAVSAEALATAFRSAWAGLAAGCLHTLAGADHLAALAPLTIGQSHLRASMLGALWGFGHSTGQLMLGLAMVVRRLGGCGGLIFPIGHPIGHPIGQPFGHPFVRFPVPSSSLRISSFCLGAPPTQLLKDRFSELVPAITKWGGAIVGLTLVAIGVLGVRLV